MTGCCVLTTLCLPLWRRSHHCCFRCDVCSPAARPITCACNRAAHPITCVSDRATAWGSSRLRGYIGARTNGFEEGCHPQAKGPLCGARASSGNNVGNPLEVAKPIFLMEDCTWVCVCLNSKSSNEGKSKLLCEGRCMVVVSYGATSCCRQDLSFWY